MIFLYYQQAVQKIESCAKSGLPFLARLVFAGTLFPLFWQSASTKFSNGLGLPSDSAYSQIFPVAYEAMGYNMANMNFPHHLIVFVGSYAEYIIPLLVVLGIFSRLSAIAMLAFMTVMTITDVVGHGAEFGAWFNHNASELIADQRAFWVLLLGIIIANGGGALSLDWFYRKFKGH